MKIIFLDIDGVLNRYCDGDDGVFDNFYEVYVNNLKRIVEETGAKIVISSSWRHAGLRRMQELWEERDLPGEIIDITPTINELYDNGYIQYYDMVSRGAEVQCWIDKHEQEIEKYVIIDDMEDFNDEQLPYFVKTWGNNHPEAHKTYGIGLTKECADRAIYILNQQ